MEKLPRNYLHYTYGYVCTSDCPRVYWYSLDFVGLKRIPVFIHHCRAHANSLTSVILVMSAKYNMLETPGHLARAPHLYARPSPVIYMLLYNIIV